MLRPRNDATVASLKVTGAFNVSVGPIGTAASRPNASRIGDDDVPVVTSVPSRTSTLMLPPSFT